MAELFNGPGWIGNWTPKIGDPTFLGWATVVAYLAAFSLSLVVLEKANLGAREKNFYRIFSVVLFALGVNKQLDLQTALTEAGRIIARSGSWYENRHRIQRRVIVGILFLGFVFGVYLLSLLRGAPRATLASAAGGVLLFLFVAIRAVSFHNFDLVIGTRIFGAKVNWILELGGLCIVSGGALARLSTSPPPPFSAEKTA